MFRRLKFLTRKLKDYQIALCAIQRLKALNNSDIIACLVKFLHILSVTMFSNMIDFKNSHRF